MCVVVSLPTFKRVRSVEGSYSCKWNLRGQPDALTECDNPHLPPNPLSYQ